MPAGGRGRGSCRWPSPGWRPSAHRGAFGADGESSDGAGVSLPLDPSLLTLLHALAGGGPAGDRDALPAAGPRRRSEPPARSSTRVFAEAGAPRRRVAARADGSERARVPRPPPRVRPSPRPSSPAPTRGAADPRPLADDAFERRLVVARRRLETAARAAGGAVGRAVGAVGVVPDDRLQGPRRRRPPGRPLSRTCARRSSSATRSSTSATRRTPIRSGDSPSRSARSPTTARSTRSAAIASRSAAAPATSAAGRSPPS